MSSQEKASFFRQLHESDEILSMVNVWDVISAKVVADITETKALATAGHSIAAAHGYPDGEQIPVELAIAAVQRIAASTDLPVSADLDGGFGDSYRTVTMAIEAGVIGANIEDQLRSLDESVRVMAGAIRAGQDAGVDFVLNARTDAFTRGGDRELDVKIADAIERGRAYLDAGATTIFVPGKLDAETTGRLVEGIGHNKVSVIGVPGALTAPEYEKLGVARITYGPWTQNVAMTALLETANALYRGETLPENTLKLN